MIKALFFDIDGTLVSFQTHRIPQSTVQALEKAKAEGIKIYISTGRPLPFINNLDQIAHLIDGYITTTGALCIVGNERFDCHSIAKDNVDKVIAAAKEWDKACVVVGAERIGVVNANRELEKQFKEGLDLHYDFYPIEEVLKEPILQISPFFDEDEDAQIMSTLHDCISSRWHPAFTDITNVKADKAKGLVSMAQHEGFDIADTMAFGDGGNDISIIRKAGIGVAMGNARDNVKAAADYVTTDIDHDGVAHALNHYHII